MTSMWVQEIWRYPVKSMAGESLQAADFTESGVAGDRIVQVRNAAGQVMTARTRPLLLRHHATLGADHQVLVDGRPWNAEDVARDVEEAAGPGTRLVQYESKDRFDILPLLVATDGMLAAVGYDTRRFRPNLVIGGVPGLSERQWEGARLHIGPVVLGDGRSSHTLHHDHVRPGFRPAGPGRAAPNPKGIQRPARTQRLCSRAGTRLCRRCGRVGPTRMNTFVS